MKQAVFADTSAWLVLINEADADHSRAKTIRNKLLHSKKSFFITIGKLCELTGRFFFGSLA